MDGVPCGGRRRRRSRGYHYRRRIDGKFIPLTRLRYSLVLHGIIIIIQRHSFSHIQSLDYVEAELGPWTYCHNKMKRLPCLLILRKWKSWIVRSRRYRGRHTSSYSCSENFAKIYLTHESASTPPPPFFFFGYRNCRSSQARCWYDIVGGRGCTIAINWNLMLRVGKYRVCRHSELALCVCWIENLPISPWNWHNFAISTLFPYFAEMQLHGDINT